MELIDFDLRASVEEVAELLAQRAHERALELVTFVDPAIPEMVFGDPGRLRPVLVNLVGNAIRFTERGEVAVLVALEDQQDDSSLVRFEVVDTGIGLTEEQQGAIFDSWFTARLGHSGALAPWPTFVRLTAHRPVQRTGVAARRATSSR